MDTKRSYNSLFLKKLQGEKKQSFAIHKKGGYQNAGILKDILFILSFIEKSHLTNLTVK